LQQAEQDGVKVATALHASGITDLRKMSAEDLMKAQQSMRGPIIDGYVLPQPIGQIFAQGKENDVALLTGWNENEGLMFGQAKNATDFQKQLNDQYGADASKFLQYYPATNDSVAKASQMDLFGRDMIFGVQNYTWANVASSQGHKVYLYRFTRKVPATGEYVKYGAFHTGEVPYAYDNLKFVDRPWQPVDTELARVMSTYWANFIKTGDPNINGLPEWKPYNTTAKQVMVLGDTQQSMPLKDAALLDLLYSKMKAF
jgi:para-nitrobenzyl esterase